VPRTLFQEILSAIAALRPLATACRVVHRGRANAKGGIGNKCVSTPMKLPVQTKT